MYGNEAAVAEAFTKEGIDPSQAFITTKLPCGLQGYEETKKAFLNSWEIMTKKERPLDMYLVHWPACDYGGDPKKKRRETWKALEEMYRKVCINE